MVKGDSLIKCDLKAFENCGSVQDSILKLRLSDSIDYSASYKFAIELDGLFKSEMTLQVA